MLPHHFVQLAEDEMLCKFFARLPEVFSLSESNKWRSPMDWAMGGESRPGSAPMSTPAFVPLLLGSPLTSSLKCPWCEA